MSNDPLSLGIFDHPRPTFHGVKFLLDTTSQTCLVVSSGEAQQDRALARPPFPATVTYRKKSHVSEPAGNMAILPLAEVEGEEFVEIVGRTEEAVGDEVKRMCPGGVALMPKDDSDEVLDENVVRVYFWRA